MIKGIAFAAGLATLAQAGIVTDTYLGYTIDLPGNWVQVKTRDQHHHFKDNSGTYPSRLSIIRHAVEKAEYPTPNTWTQTQFIGYKLAVETSAYPFGMVAYFDSSASRKLGADWAPEAFSILFPGDGQRTYCEFIRYASRGDWGYEVYAIGDSADMMNRVDYYAGILATVTFSEPTGIIKEGRRSLLRRKEGDELALTVDPQGRLVQGDPLRRPAFGIRFSRPLRSP